MTLLKPFLSDRRPARPRVRARMHTRVSATFVTFRKSAA